MRPPPITLDEHAAIKLALGYNADIDRITKVARQFSRGVSTVGKINCAGGKRTR